MSAEDDLTRLARERESASEVALTALIVDRPDILRRHFRAYLSRQVDLRRIRRPAEAIPGLGSVDGGLKELACLEGVAVEFLSGSLLDFSIQLEEHQRGWWLKRFKFHLRMPGSRAIGMVCIHLNHKSWHDPLAIPRCHLHVDDSRAHVPFPMMNPRLILHLLCEPIEPDFGLEER